MLYNDCNKETCHPLKDFDRADIKNIRTTLDKGKCGGSRITYVDFVVYEVLSKGEKKDLSPASEEGVTGLFIWLYYGPGILGRFSQAPFAPKNHAITCGGS